MPELIAVPLDAIRDPAFVLRSEIDEAGVRELADSIRAVGLLQPPGVVRDGDVYRLVFGHRRFLACRFLGLPTITVRVFEPGESSELEASTAENVVRRDLSPVEEAQAIRHMVEGRGRTVRDVALALGRSESWVRQRLEVLLWPEAVVAAVAAGDVSVSVARELVLVEDENWRTHLLRCAVENGVTAVQMRMWRGEWESRRLVGGGIAGEPEGVAPAGPVPLPKASCSMCGELHVISGMQFLRFCAGCVDELSRAKHQASAGE